MKILIIIVLAVLCIGSTIYLYKSYGKNNKLSAKITEMIVIETLGYIFLGLIVLNPNKEYNMIAVLDILQWISFFCLFFFLFYNDYGNVEDEKQENLNSKKELFLYFVKKSGKSNIVLSKNKNFLFFLILYIVLEIIKHFI